MGSTGFSKERLARLHDVLARHVTAGLGEDRPGEQRPLPGLVTALSRHGVVHLEAIGTLAVDGAEPMRPDTIFRISSMTKPITAAATMILVEEARLRLDDPVDRLLPELADRQVLRRLDSEITDTVPARRPITTRDLLTFTAGCGMLLAPPGSLPIQRALTAALGADGPPQPGSSTSPDDWIRRLGSVPLVHQPGECWMYNTGSDVLAVLIARAAGQPFDTFLRERIFEPLDMADTGFSVPASQIHRLATSYQPDRQTGELSVYDPAAGGQWSRPPAMPSGAGGLVSTAPDYLAFGHLMLNYGQYPGGRLLSRASVELMTTDQLTGPQKAATQWMPGYFDSHGWGFGMSVQTRRENYASVGSFGWDGGMGTTWATDRREGLTGILLTQRNWVSPVPPAICTDFWTAGYSALE